jgi:RHS repeat-associated protein
VRSFVWGLDLSGSLQGAGGVGGLLFICDVPSAVGDCAPAYDGNGNVAALVSMSGGTNCATYEYGPFGEVIRATGPMAKVNPFRFSTKCQDDETDTLYYGYRYYNASTGQWLSRDPIEERGGKNLYGFAEANPVDRTDGLGLCCTCKSVRIDVRNSMVANAYFPYADLGVPVKTTIQVDGNPKECHCVHSETGCRITRSKHLS